MKTMTTDWTINLREDELSLSEALSIRVPAASRAFLNQLCKKARVSLNGTPAAADRQVKAGDRICVKPSGRFLECVEQSRIHPAQVLHEDPWCVVINKPAGLAIHHARGLQDNQLDRLSEFFKLRGEPFRVAPVHRLDIGTSGAVLFGKGRSAIGTLGRMMMDGQIRKRYLALVAAVVVGPGELTSAVPAKGMIKPALTRYRPLTTAGDLTLLDLSLVTGRRHQIRHQLATSGWPIVGDARYRGREIAGLSRPFLHCCRLSFPDSETGRIIVTDCPLADDLLRILELTGFPTGTDWVIAE